MKKGALFKMRPQSIHKNETIIYLPHFASFAPAEPERNTFTP